MKLFDVGGTTYHLLQVLRCR